MNGFSQIYGNVFESRATVRRLCTYWKVEVVGGGISIRVDSVFIIYS